MAHSKFSVSSPAFQVCTRTMIQPVHIMALQVEEEDMDAAQIFHPLGAPAPAPQEEPGEQAAHPTENLLGCIMGDGCDLHVFQEYEVYHFGVDSGSDCDVPEDDSSDDETEDDISIEGNQPILEKDNSAEEGQPILEEEDKCAEENQPILEEDNSAKEDQPSPGNVQVVDNRIEGFQVSPENTPEEENPTEGDQPSSVNLHVTLVNLQVTAEDPSTPRQLAVNMATFEGVYSEADRDKIPGIHMDVQVQTVIATSAEEGLSSCSSRILMDIQLDPKTEPNTHELSKAMESSDTGVQEALMVDFIEAGAQDS